MVPLPQEIIEKQRFVNIYPSITFYVQGLTVLLSISRNFQFRTAEFILHKNKASDSDTIQGVKRVIIIYQARGLLVTKINGDNDF